MFIRSGATSTFYIQNKGEINMYEYKTVKLYYGVKWSGTLDLDIALNDYAKEGWRVVSVVGLEDCNGVIVFFERII